MNSRARIIEHHVPVAPVLETRELGTDLLIPAALLPELRGMHDGQRHLHAPDGHQLLAEDLLYVHHRLPREWKVREDPLAKLTDVARP